MSVLLLSLFKCTTGTLQVLLVQCDLDFGILQLLGLALSDSPLSLAIAPARTGKHQHTLLSVIIRIAHLLRSSNASSSLVIPPSAGCAVVAGSEPAPVITNLTKPYSIVHGVRLFDGQWEGKRERAAQCMACAMTCAELVNWTRRMTVSLLGSGIGFSAQLPELTEMIRVDARALGNRSNQETLQRHHVHMYVDLVLHSSQVLSLDSCSDRPAALSD